MSERGTLSVDMADFPRSLLEKFILLYKDQPCLWDRSSRTYKDKIKRKEALTKLTKLLQQHFPRATKEHVMMKICSLRSSMRRELGRVLDSRSQATDPDEVYSPHVWYYELCTFIYGENGDRYRRRPHECTCDQGAVG